MERYICDACGAQGTPETANTTPKGWYSVYRPYDGKSVYVGGTRHLCSPDCLLLIAGQNSGQAALARLAAEAEAPHV